jgi:hypothetical protein
MARRHKQAEKREKLAIAPDEAYTAPIFLIDR